MSGFKVNTNFGSDTFVVKPNFDIKETANLKNIEFFENGIYKPEDYGADGFGEVNIDVQPVLEELTITANGEYTPQEGVDGFSKVVAEFDTSSLPKVKVTKFKVTNDCINEDGIWEGENLIDTSEVTDMTQVFMSCSRLIELDVSQWDTSKVTSFYLTFRDCSLKTLDANNFDMSNCTNIRGMFYGCSSLTTLRINKWDVSNVTNAITMFYDCEFEEVDVSEWDVSNFNSLFEIFFSCSKLKKLDLSNWQVGKAEATTRLFNGCNRLQSLIGNRTIDDVLANNIGALNGLKVALSLNDTILDRASLRAVINGLADLTGQTAQTLTLGATLRAKLTEEDIAIAVNKNWTVS